MVKLQAWAANYNWEEDRCHPKIGRHGRPLSLSSDTTILYFSSHMTAFISTSLTRHLSPPVTSDDEYDQFSCKYSHQIMTTATRAQNFLFIILKHTVLLSDVERKQGTRTLVSICQLGRQMLQMGQRRSLADSPNGTDVKMGGERGRRRRGGQIT